MLFGMDAHAGFIAAARITTVDASRASPFAAIATAVRKPIPARRYCLPFSYDDRAHGSPDTIRLPCHVFRHRDESAVINPLHHLIISPSESSLALAFPDVSVPQLGQKAPLAGFRIVLVAFSQPSAQVRSHAGPERQC